jgi:hypothetical protein
MSYNYYCYGQIQDKDGKWIPFSDKPFADNLKYIIDWDEIPDCFERVLWDDSDRAKEGVADVFVERFKDVVSFSDIFVVRLDKFISYFQNQATIQTAKLTGILNCMGIEGNINWYDEDELYNLIENNPQSEKQKSIPVAKSALFEIIKSAIALSKINYLLDIAKVFESMAYDCDDFVNEKKSFLIVRE